MESRDREFDSCQPQPSFLLALVPWCPMHGCRCIAFVWPTSRSNASLLRMRRILSAIEAVQYVAPTPAEDDHIGDKRAHQHRTVRYWNHYPPQKHRVMTATCRGILSSVPACIKIADTSICIKHSRCTANTIDSLWLRNRILCCIMLAIYQYIAGSTSCPNYSLEQVKYLSTYFHIVAKL